MPLLDFDEYSSNVARAKDYMWSWIRQARVDFEFAALKQWREEDREALEQQLRPALVFDVTRPLIKAITGAETTNRYKAKFTGFNLELEEIDRAAAASFDYFYNWVRLHGKNEHHESLAFQDLSIAGLGCIDTYVDYSKFRNGIIYSKRVPPFDVGFDPSSLEPNVEDRTFCYRDRYVPEKLFLALYPDSKDVLGSIKGKEGGNVEGPLSQVRRKVGQAYSRRFDQESPSAGQGNEGGGYDRASGSIRVRDYQWKELDFMTRILGRDTASDTGEIVYDEFVPQSKAREQMQSLEEEATSNKTGLTYEAQPNHPVENYYRAHVAGDYVLAEENMGIRSFTLQFMTGEEDWSQYLGDKGNGYKYYFGLMRSMRDPQSYRNKFFSQAVHIFNSNPKGLLIYETDMFENVDQAMASWNKAEGSIGVEPGKLNGPHGQKFQHINHQFSFQGTQPLFENATGATYEAAGINPSVTGGQATDLRRVATTSLETVRTSNLASLGNYFDALRLYRKGNAELTLELARKYFPLEVVQRIVGKKHAEAAAAMFHMDVQDYDVVVEEAEAGNTPTEDMFTAVMQNLPNMLQMGFPVPPEIFEYVAAFLPTDVAQAWTQQIRDFYENQANQPPGGTQPTGDTGDIVQ